MVAVLDAPRNQGGERDVNASILDDVMSNGRLRSALTDAMPQAVKGAGFAGLGRGVRGRDGSVVQGIAPMADDDPMLFRLAFNAERGLRQSVRKSFRNPRKVMKGLNANFLNQFGGFMAGMDAPGGASNQWMVQFLQQVQGALGELGKNIN